MSELYYIPNPDNESPIGLLEVPVVGFESIDHQVEYASLMGRVEESGQGKRSGYRAYNALTSGGILREFLPYILEAVHTTADGGDVVFLTQDGLCTDSGEADLMTPALYDPYATYTGLSENEEVLVSQLEAAEALRTEDANKGNEDDGVPRPVKFGFQLELVWREDEKGVAQPKLLTDREHRVLGYLAASGVFEPVVVTILSLNEPESDSWLALSTV